MRVYLLAPGVYSGWWVFRITRVDLDRHERVHKERMCVWIREQRKAIHASAVDEQSRG